MKNMMRLLGTALVAIIFAACQQARQDAEASPDEGAKLFIDNCARCHLSTGAGGPAPGGLNAPDLRQFNKTPAEISEIVTNGFGRMPSFKDTISDVNISLIAAYVAAQIERHPGQ